MKNEKKKQKIYATTVTIALTAGVAVGVSSYRSGIQFQPTQSNREMKENRVSFSGNGENTDQVNGQNQDNSALWEKDQNLQEEADKSAYLFEQVQKELTPSQTTIKVADDQNQKMPDVTKSDTQNQQKEQEPVYKITDKKSDADTVINGDTQKPSDSGNGNGNNSGNKPDKPGTNGDGDGTSESEKPSKPKPTNPDRPQTPDTSDNSGENKPDPKPSTPASTAKDPAVTKPRPGISTISPSEAFQEDKVTSSSVNIIVKILEDSMSEAALYKGQSIDEHLLFCALDTYVYELNSQRVYLWGTNDYGKYIKITGVSFDGGKSWNSKFPVTIPEDLKEDDMCIKVKYRLAQKRDWEEIQVAYHPKDTRLFLLSRRLEKENEELTSDMILNYEQYPDLGTTLNLLDYLANFMGWDRLNALFPGWMEDGELLPWNYEITAGRHLLEPSELIPLDSFYVAMIRYQWVLPNGRIDEDNDSLNSQYCALQTLVGIEQEEGEDGRKYVTRLEVPKYMQAVCMEEPVETDTLSISDTVVYVKNDGTYLRVNKAYEVDKENQNYTSEGGMLFDKEKTQILGIPYDVEELTVPKNIEKVKITGDNQIKVLQIKADSIDKVPQIKFENLKDCKVVVEDEILDDMLKLYGEKLTVNQNCIAASSNPDRTYTISNGIVVDNHKELYRVFDYNGSSLRIPPDIVSIGDGAFQYADQIRTLIWPKNIELELSKESFDGSNINRIICYSQEQLEEITAQLEMLGISDITVFLSRKTSDGFAYYSEGADGEVVTTLTDAPEDLREFDGTIENGTIEVNSIEANAFSNCKSLEWVTLPEKVTSIGYQAFRSCTALQGILINTKDEITIGDQAFDGCSSLRFVASNTPKAVMEGEYDPLITNQENADGITQYSFFFVPQGAEGYGNYANSLAEYQGVAGYVVCDVGEGGKVLYAVNEDGERWLALRSSGTLEGTISLPEETLQFFAYSFSGCGGAYQINWADLPVESIQEGVFYESQLCGDVVLGDQENPNGLYLREYAFAKCAQLNSVTINDTLVYLGMQIFADDTALKSVTVSEANSGVSFPANTFAGCSQMENLTMRSRSPMQLSTYGTMRYQFNSNDWTTEEEENHIHLSVPDGTAMDYIMQWRYIFAGSVGMYTGSVYMDLWNDVQAEMVDWTTGSFPTDEEVDAAVKERLLEAENRLRKMIGTDLVSEPTELYQFRMVGINLALVGIPSYSTDITLSPETVDMPDGWYLDEIASGAFSGASNLRSVTIPANMSQLDSGMLTGSAENSEKITLQFEGTSPLTLSGYDPDHPFDFGIEEKKVRIQVPSGKEKAYVGTWTYPLAGYSNQKEMEDAVTEKLKEAGKEPTEEELQQEMAAQLMPVENRLRTMMGMDTIENPEDLISYGYVPEEPETESELESESESETESETDMQESESQSESEKEPETESETAAQTETEEESTQTEESESSQTESESMSESENAESSSEVEKEAEEAQIRQETNFQIVLEETEKETKE